MKELLFPIGVNLVLGVVLLALLLWKRRPDTVCFADDAAALQEFHQHFPDATGTVTLCSDGRAALIETATGVGLLVRDGRRWNARMLVAHELTAMRLRDPRTLELRFADFGWPRARLRFADPDLLSRWRSRLEALERSPGNSHTDLRHA